MLELRNPDTFHELDANLINEIYSAHEIVRSPDSLIKPPEIIYDDLLSEQYEAEVFLISELHQAIGSYKGRGVVNFKASLTEDELEAGVTLASAGNHSQAGTLFIDNTDAFMPKGTPATKIKRVQRNMSEKSRLFIVGNSFEECNGKALEHNEREGRTFMPPFDHPKIIAGQGTLGIGLPEFDQVFIPVGGGGLIAGVGTAIKHNYPDTIIVGAEPNGAASMNLALQKGSPTHLDTPIDKFVDGASVACVGDHTFNAARKIIDDMVTIDNLNLRQTVSDFWLNPRRPNIIRPLVKVELAGGLSVAALEQKKEQIKGQRIACLLSGGCLDEERFIKEVYLPQNQ